MDKIYHLTESEYKELLDRERTNGAEILSEYIIFCYNNYYLAKNITGLCEFLKDLFRFLANESSYIHNKYGYSFGDFIEYNKKH